MDLNAISPLTMVHLTSLLYCWPGAAVAFDADDHAYDLYDSLEDELDHPSTTTASYPLHSGSPIEEPFAKQIENVTTHSPLQLANHSSTASNSTSFPSGAFNATTVVPSKLPVTPKVDASYFTSGYPRSSTTKRAAPQEQSDPNEVICLRYSRTNCDSGYQGANEQAIQVRASSVWHCLSTKQSPACICTCDGSCDPVIAIKPVNASQGASPPRVDSSVAGGQVALPCSDCSCLYASVGPGSCLCTPGCG